MELNTQEIKQLNSIEKVIEKAKGKLTLAEISAETALPLDSARSLLNVLLERYICRVQMDSKSGNLLFNFEYPLRRRSAKSFKEIAVAIAEKSWKVFQIVYKAAVGIVMIAYTIFFVLLLLAASSRNSDSDNDDNSGMLMGILRAIIEALQFKAIVDMNTDYVNDGAYRYKQYRKPENKGKGFIMSIFHLVFGPDRPKYDPLSDTLEAIAFIRQNNGKLNPGQIVALTGVDYDTAESKLAEYAGKFVGELYIDEDGVVTGEFHQLLHVANAQLKGGLIEYYKNEIDPPVEFTGNTAGKNVAILAMNTFNLVMSVYVMGMFEGSGLGFFAGVFPLIISILYFIMPIVRYPFYLKAQSKREYSILRKKAVGLAVDFPDTGLRTEDFQTVTNIQANEINRLNKILLTVTSELQGEVVLNESGKAVYKFPRLARELKKK